ncbi:TPA: morphogenetic protein [Salmonella enterica subsp. enterica serovar Potsdam]|uniref:morphogenetic protein n=1 Tax=Salmonella enterica TaxID=28901 RepID=UPI000B500AD0|nr:morphogenetic protein [Salmonella enterica]EBU6210444.1 morphogenetic protein [Salmonella enterica subsp. enterica]ASD97624.1 morphogenetic protein [Salmonella enterica subsp. enterica serovar Onderstepoort str. SA20060086]EAO1688175.1 morphogenetic protein [Salmonella enterica]EAR8729864.1 morphogenetic protein [Salmonella enterica]EAY2125527.1 morphogenetic protein [Salmonella enterica]
MTERGMIFNSEMVRAILDGRKTQTRRIMKNQPAGDRPDSPALIRNVGGGFQWYGHYGESSIFNCPLGSIGDRIWVRETYQGPLFDYEQMESYLEDSSKFEKPEFCKYAADGKPAPEYYDADDNLHCGWRPSIHMPRWASRILLEITDVRVERLNAITESDAEAEGITDTGFGDLLVDGYRYRWKSIYGDDSWQVNPWVWVIEFKRIGGDVHATD